MRYQIFSRTYIEVASIWNGAALASAAYSAGKTATTNVSALDAGTRCCKYTPHKLLQLGKVYHSKPDQYSHHASSYKGGNGCILSQHAKRPIGIAISQ